MITDDLPFVAVTGIGGFKQQGRGSGLQHGRQNNFQPHITHVWAFIVTPTNMHPHLFGRDVASRVVEHLNVTGNTRHVFVVFGVFKHHVPAQA